MLLLFPAAFLIVLTLGSLAIDAAVVHLRQRDLASAAGAAANDAAMLGIDQTQLREGGALVLDPLRVERAVVEALQRRGALEGLLEPPTIRLVDDRTIEVHLVAHASYLIAPALPGAPDGAVVRATGRASAVLDDGVGFAP